MRQIIKKPILEDLFRSTSSSTIIPYIEEAFVAYSTGRAVVPPVGTLVFSNPPGETHIKYGYLEEDTIYVIKIASGFYDNPKRGLSSSNGCVLVFNQKNGLLEKLFLDEGLLTDIRTAVAGAVVAKHLAPEKVYRIGIMGTGIQARLQLDYLRGIIDCKEVLVWGRSLEKLQSYQSDMAAKGFQIEGTLDAEEIAKSCNYIVSTTPATEAILHAEYLQADTHITAMGADTKGKQELDLEIIKKAETLVCDSKQQCLAHGELHKAAAAGLLDKKDILELGAILAAPSFERAKNSISIADLTGIATQDIQIAKFVLAHV